MTPKEKAKGFIVQFAPFVESNKIPLFKAKKCALIAVENEYNSLREQLFNLRSCHVIESESVYLKRIADLIEEEKQIKIEIEKLK